VGIRTEKMRQLQQELARRPAPLTRATEQDIAEPNWEPRAKTPASAALVAFLGFLVWLVGVYFFVVAARNGWDVADSVYFMAALCGIGGMLLIALAAVIRQLAARS